MKKFSLKFKKFCAVQLLEIREVIRRLRSMFLLILMILELSSCVRYPLIVRIKYKEHVGKEDTLIFVSKKFDYVLIKNKTCPEDPCGSGCFQNVVGKRRWGLMYEARNCADLGDRLNFYLIIVDRWGRRIEEGEHLYPCEGYFNGKYKAYHKNGNIFATGQLNKRGDRCGTWWFYNTEGKLMKERYYKEPCE